MFITCQRSERNVRLKSYYNRFNRIYDADYILVCKRQEGQANDCRIWIHGNRIHIKSDLYVGVKQIGKVYRKAAITVRCTNNP